MSPNWKRHFKSIPLADGRTIACLAKARDFIASLPEESQKTGQWKYASDLLLRAADQNEKYSTGDARAQMTRALKASGFL